MADRHPFLYVMTLIAPRPNYTLNCRRGPLELGPRTFVMGILNTTPDSFADGGRYLDPLKAIDHALTMVADGADIIDIGGESTRPAGPYGAGAAPVSVEEECRRTLPIIEAIASKIPIPISIDTTKAEIARRALDAGADIINDISALRFDAAMSEVAAQTRAPVVLMHMQGTPQTMQAHPHYRHLMREITEFLAQRISAAVAAGVAPSQIAIDPGLGFGKTYAHNARIIARLPEFQTLDCPVIMGPSRKKFTAPDARPEDRLPGTLGVLALCAVGGAHIVRVHDVGPAVQAVALADRIRFESGETPPKSA